MTQALPKKITLDEFIQWYPNDGKCYELHKGLIIEMPPPKGKHEKVIGFLAEKFTIEYVKLGLRYCIPKTAFVKTPFAESVYSPDVLLLNLDNLNNEPLFEKQSTICQAASAPLVVEVVSSNWQDDYYDKLGDYVSVAWHASAIQMGIPEYWIADYDALGAKNLLVIQNSQQFLFAV
jgi:Uma2 family endonuclease